MTLVLLSCNGVTANFDVPPTLAARLLYPPIQAPNSREGYTGIMKTKEGRRHAVRFPMELPGTLRWQEQDRVQTANTRTKDISRTGLYIRIENKQIPTSRI